jgi:chromosome segregation ATPase
MAVPHDDCREPTPPHPASELLAELDRRELERLRTERTEVEKELAALQVRIDDLQRLNDSITNRCHAQSEALSGRATSASIERDACYTHLTSNAADLARKGMVDIAHVVACLAEDICRGVHRK